MKLKYIIPSFIAAILTLVGCSNEKYEATYLDGLRVSSSYVSLSLDGSSNTITVTANDDWTLENTNDWLTVAPASGAAGETTVTLSAAGALSARTATVKFVSGSKVQEVNIVQGKKVAELATCKEIAEGADGKTFRVRASITQIANTKYGNMYIADETGSVYVYGTLDKEGKTASDPISSWGLEVGDIVTVEGPKKLYNGTVELIDVTVVKVEKWFVKMIDPESAPVIAKEGGTLKVKAAFKGKGIIPLVNDTCNWIHYKNMEVTAGTVTAVNPNPADTAVITFTVDPNDPNDPNNKQQGRKRNGGVTFLSTNGKASSSITWDVLQKGLVEDVTVGAFLAAEVGTDEYRLLGVITELYYYKEAVSGFYISDHSGKVLVYKPSGFTGTEAKVGDVVTVVGQRGAYKETPQMVSCKLETVKYSATKATISEFRNAPDDKEKYYLISGTINKVAEADKGAKDDIEKYGNFDLTDETGSVYIYGVLTGWGGSKGKFGDLKLTYGDKLTVIAYKTTYKGLVEGVAVYVSHEKAAQ